VTLPVLGAESLLDGQLPVTLGLLSLLLEVASQTEEALGILLLAKALAAQSIPLDQVVVERTVGMSLRCLVAADGVVADVGH
jgi:hypothetical protein